MPIAQLSVPAKVHLGVRVLLDARGSSDPEGKQLRYRYDFNDGSPSVVTGASSTHHVFQSRGLFPVCVWVTDVDGLTASECRELTVAPAPDAGSPDGSRDAGPDGDGPLHPTDAAGEGKDGSGKDGFADKPKADQPKPDQGPKLDGKLDSPKPDLPKPDAPKPDAPKPDLPKPDQSKPDQSKPDQSKPDQSKPVDGGSCLAPEVGGTGASGYTLKLVPACQLPSGAVAKLGINKDEVGVLTILPFSFSFFGKAAVAAGVSANGYLQFVGANPLALLEPFPVAIPNPQNPNNLVAAFWDNLSPISSASDVWVSTLGQAPKRVYRIEWQGWTFSGLPAPHEITFVIYLYEGSNVIELQYSKLDGGSRATGSAASIGIENEAGTSGLQHAFQKAGAVSTSQGIRFIPK